MKKFGMCAVLALLLAVLLSTGIFASERRLIPGGNTVGIRLNTKGLLITDFEAGSPAKAAGLRKGDVIICANGISVNSAEALRESLQRDRVVLTVLRNDRPGEFCVTPITTAEGKKLGIYIRNSVSGIGTVTYYDPQSGAFGALGHGVNDKESMSLMPMQDGVLVQSEILSVEKGKRGCPGELKGKFDNDQIVGRINSNLQQGIFGTMSAPPDRNAIPIAEADSIKKGSAVILSNIRDREVKPYTVEIVEIHANAARMGRNLLLKITDSELLSQTGGIVQGMSGSPILQNGRIVGAVTHVLVNDPTRGYGIFIENMLDAAG